MTTITIDEYVNGFGVRVYDPKDGYSLNEFHEEKVDALKALRTVIDNQILKEYQGRINYAATL